MKDPKEETQYKHYLKLNVYTVQGWATIVQVVVCVRVCALLYFPEHDPNNSEVTHR